MRWLLCLMFVVGCAGSRQTVRWNGVSDKPLAARNISKVANHSDEPPFLNGWPEHICFAHAEDSLTPWFNPQEAQLRVFEIKKYRAIFHGAEREEFDKRLSDLKSAIHGDASRFPDILPAVEASPAFYTNFSPVCFDGGCGVRAVTMYVQDNNLVENGRLFYTLQGLSTDQRYWIAAFWPVQAEGIRMQSHDLSADEIAILNSPQLYAEYLSEQLDILEEATYDPPLESIDEIVSGLKLEIK